MNTNDIERVLITEEQIAKRVDEIAEEINASFLQAPNIADNPQARDNPHKKSSK